MFRHRYAARLVLAALCVVPMSDTLAQAPVEMHLLKDLDTSVGPDASRPYAFLSQGGKVYFTAYTPATGTELFRTDGTPGGLQLVRDLVPGGDSSFARLLGAVGNTLVAGGSDLESAEAQVWAIGGDGATAQILRRVAYANRQVVFSALATIAGKVVFRASAGPPLWASDGTPAGTVDVSGALGDGTQVLTQNICVLDGAVVMPLIDAGGQRRLVSSDGTAAGTFTAATFDATYVFQNSIPEKFAVRVGNRCYFPFVHQAGNEYSWELWRSDGTAAGTSRVAVGGPHEWVAGIGKAGGLVHVAITAAEGWRMLRQQPGTETYAPVGNAIGPVGWSSLVTVGDVMGYAAPTIENGSYRIGYFLTDGTDAGTRRVHVVPSLSRTLIPAFALNHGIVFRADEDTWVDAATGAVSTAPAPNKLFTDDSALLGPWLIGAGGSASGVEVSRTDGTDAGTMPLHDVWATTASGLTAPGEPAGSAVFGDRVYFAGAPEPIDANFRQITLWTSDGTEAGTHKLPGSFQNGVVRTIVPTADGVLFQNLIYGSNDAIVYRADPALTGVTRLPGSLSTWSELLPVDGGAMYLCNESGGNARKLCRADAGSGTVSAFAVDVAETNLLYPIGTLDGISIFIADRIGDIWRSDGTAPGTFRIRAANRPEPFSDQPLASAEFGGRLYFNHCRAAGDCALVVTDGTVDGTMPVAPLPLDYLVSSAVVGGRLVLATSNGQLVQLWATDGSPAGTQPLWSQAATYVSDVVRVGDRVHVVAGCVAGCAVNYLVSDGTPAGTRPATWPAAAPLPTGHLLAALGNVAVYSCELPRTGIELCATDREAQNAQMVSDLWPGYPSSQPRLIAATPGALYIAADDGTHGREPWLLRERDAIFANGFEAAAGRPGR